MKQIRIAPSILSADLLQLEAQVKLVEKSGADLIHVDIMDGHFVPNITFGPVIVKTLRKITTLPLDVHLMITNVDQYIPEFAKAGADFLTIHQEAGPHLHRSLQLIRDLGVKTGVALNPGTSLTTIEPLLADLDLVLLMTVNPGFGGQSYIPLVSPKIEQLAGLKKKHGYRLAIEVDGGINPDTIREATKAGAEILVAGNAIFNQDDIQAACRILKEIAEKTISDVRQV